MTSTAGSDASNKAMPLVQIRWIHPFLDALDELGVPSEKLLERAHLPVLALDNPKTLVPTARVWDFVALAIRATGVDDFGLRAGKWFRIETLLLDREAAWARPGTFRTIEGFIAATLETSSNSEMWLESREGPQKTIALCFLGTFGPEHAAFRAAEQFWVALMVRFVRFAAGPRWSPARVDVRAASVPRSAMRDLVGEATLSTRHNVTSIIFPSQPYLGPIEPIPEKGSAAWTRHRQELERGETNRNLTGSLRLVLKSYLPDGSPTIERAAELTGMSIRTLQRRLESEGVSYSQLLEELRHDLALYLLRNPEARASQVARELGYRDPAIFTRSFRRWTGQTPSQYRRALWSKEWRALRARRSSQSEGGGDSNTRPAAP